MYGDGQQYVLNQFLLLIQYPIGQLRIRQLRVCVADQLDASCRKLPLCLCLELLQSRQLRLYPRQVSRDGAVKDLPIGTSFWI